MRSDLIDVLNAIDPAVLTYDEWLSVGFALHKEGYTSDVWDSWSAKDAARYVPGDCAKRWAGFGRNTGSVITGGSLVDIAKEHGWSPTSDPGYALDWESSIGSHDDYVVIDKNWVEEKDIPGPKMPFNGVDELVRYLSNLFEPNENVGYVTQSYETSDHRRVPTKGSFDRTAGQLIEALNKCNGDIGAVLGDYNQEAGAWIRFNPLDGKGVKNDNVTEYRYALVESDTLAIEKQYAIMLELQLPIAVMVHSGGKSLHAIIRIDAANYDEYRKRVDFLYSICQKNGMQLDRQNRNPSRLSRMPGVIRNGNPQYIIAENIGCESFTAWKEYIESINDDLPDMEDFNEIRNNLPELAPELIEGVLRRGHKLLISGPSKAGKSFAMIELCIAITEGGRWFGFKCNPGNVLYINLEIDPASCLHRIDEVYKAMGIEPSGNYSITVWNLRGRTEPMDKLAPKLIRRAKKKNFAAIVIDPIFKVLTGDENSADQMAAFCNQFDKIATDLGCSVLYCHHHSKGSQGQKSVMDRASGSGVFARDPDALLDLIRLNIPEKYYEKKLEEKQVELCSSYLCANVQEWDEGMNEQMLSNPTILMNRCEAELSEDALELLRRELAGEERRIRDITAWRMDGVLREFPSFLPKMFWFEHPIHRLDLSGEMATWKAEGEHGQTDAANEARAAQKELSPFEKIEQAISYLLTWNDKASIPIKDMAGFMGVKVESLKRYLRDYLKEHSEYDLLKVNGKVFIVPTGSDPTGLSAD